MNKRLLVLCSVLLSASMAMAADKLVSEWNCAKSSDAHSIDVGDQANHSYAVTKTTCTAVKSEIGGVKEKEGVGTGFTETKGDQTSWHGVFVVTMANGDQIHYSYSNKGMGTNKDGQFQSGANQWSIVGGTGKFKGAKGSGTCQGKGNADGGATWNCEGTYTLAK
ncbi:MAG: hypothetical protein WAQ52_10260 [Terriglobales bacterium]